MSLVYNVSTLLQEAIGSVREYEIDDRVLIDDTEPRSERVVGLARFLRTRQGVLVTTHLRGEQRELCSRCLREIEVPIQIDQEDEFFATVNTRTGISMSRPEDPEAFLIDARQQLDLEEAVRQAWLTALPMRVLCRSDCPGLCPICGKDLNEGPCACPPPGDERWDALRPLVAKREGK